MEKLLIHGHSCCEVRTTKSSFICDPWLYGSAYWRSWWNFPEPEKIDNLIDAWKSQENVYIYITHLHWDHFHGPTIRKIAKQIPQAQFFVPLTPETRIKDDLKAVLPKGKAIKELKHAKTTKINSEFEVTSFQSGPIAADSAIAIKCKTLILNLNDSKIFKRSMKHLLSLIGQPSIVMRSHASANSRCCMKVTNGTISADKSKDDYSSEFTDSCYGTGAALAIPFASNMAHLHKETFRYNSILNFSDNVVDYYQENKSRYPGMTCLQILPGEEFDLETQKLVKYNNNQRELLASTSKTKILSSYQDQKSKTLAKQYKLEDSARINEKAINKYFLSIMNQTPWIIRNLLKDHVCIEAISTKGNQFFKLNFSKKEIFNEKNPTPGDKDIHIKVNAYVLNDVCIQRHWNSLGVSKRLEIIQSKQNKTYMLLGIVCNSIESGGFISLRNAIKPRTLRVWISRRREIIDLISITLNVFFNKNYTGKVDTSRKVLVRPFS